MKKSLIAFLMLATFAMTFTGCKKDKEEEDKGPELTENSWIIDGKKYELANSLFKPSYSGGTLSAIGTGGALGIKFAEKPTANGTYSIKTPTTELGANECSVLFVGEPAFYSTGKSGDVAKVTVSGGKIRVELSKIEIETTDGESNKKGVLSANILEN